MKYMCGIYIYIICCVLHVLDAKQLLKIIINSKGCAILIVALSQTKNPTFNFDKTLKLCTFGTG